MTSSFIYSLLCSMCLLSLRQVNGFTNPADNIKNIRTSAPTTMNTSSNETKKKSPLDASVVWDHVNHVLDEVNPSLTQKLGIFLRPIADLAEKGGGQENPPLYFALEIVKTGEQETDQVSFLSFYVGYSTWEGPCVFVDQLGGREVGPNDQLYLQILAKIAVRLDSSRLTWKRHYPPQPNWYQSNPIGPPDILNELHILHMDQDAMKAYVDYSAPSSSTLSLDRFSVEEQSKIAIEEALNAVSNKPTSQFSIRLAEANSVEDARGMEQMVKGLAIFVKEPLEDIHCDVNDYLIDGSGNQPLYYTFLLEADDKEGKKQVCGSAVIYFGYSYQNGHYLYLEDLYVDEAYQDRGAGSLALRMLTRLALKLNCESFQWLALDWNKPALNLYQNKMGAKILEGKKVTRYTDSKLKDFADGFSSTLSGM